MKFSLIAIPLGMAISAYLYSDGNRIWMPIAIATLIIPVALTTDMYNEINLAKRQFRTNATYSVLKFGTLTLVAAALSFARVDVLVYMCLYYVIVGAFHLAFLRRHDEVREAPASDSDDLKRQSIRLSATGIFPLLLEHADKFLIGYFFGLEALGIYTIGISTGRLMLHFVKPLTTLFFSHLVLHKLDTILRVALAVGLTLVGLAGAWLLQHYFTYVLGAKFAASYPTAAVVTAGLGVHSLGVLSYYSSIYHKESDVRVPTLTNIITAAAMVLYLLVATLLGGSYALILCAASYPLRELCNLIVISFLTRRFSKHA
jgi:O-antigen/teichoic acid export membrane protein